MKLCRFALISIVSVIILMMGCSSSDHKPAESSNPPAVAAQPEVKQPVLYTGVEAFNPMIGLAMKWAPEPQSARLEAVFNSRSHWPERKNHHLERILRLAESPRCEDHRLLWQPTPRRSAIRYFDRGQ
jgi:hypothetical protein